MFRSILIGGATGILSQSGFAAIVLNTPPERLPNIMRSPWVKQVTLALAAGEMVANIFISWLPPRTTPGPLFGRIAMGAGNAAMLAHANREPLAGPAIVGGATAAVAASLATTSRALLTTVIPDNLFASVETAVSFTMAHKATQQRTPQLLGCS